MATGHQLDFLLTMKYGKWMIFLKLVLVRRSNNLLSWSLFSSGHVLWLVSASSHFGHHGFPKHQDLNHFFPVKVAFIRSHFLALSHNTLYLKYQNDWEGEIEWMFSLHTSSVILTSTSLISCDPLHSGSFWDNVLANITGINHLSFHWDGILYLEY